MEQCVVARRPRVAAIAAVTWRDGVHITGTPIWCDARRRRDICFVSSADRVGRAEHGQLIGTATTLDVMESKDGGNLKVPLLRRFTLGTLRLELLASGRGPGAAALHIDLAGRTVMYAGGVRIEAVPDAAIAGADIRACDALAIVASAAVTETYPRLALTISQTLEWTRAQLAAGKRPVLVVETALDGIEVARALGSQVAVSGGPSVKKAMAAVGMKPPLDARAPRAVVATAGERAGIVKAAKATTCALVGWRAVHGIPSGYDAAFPWTNAASMPALLEWIRATGASEIFVTGAAAEGVAAALGPRARVIGPPRQMMLFPREAS